jgi:hypothetical protein
MHLHNAYLLQVEVWNLRLRLMQLSGGIREAARYGPMKQPDKAGLDEVWYACCEINSSCMSMLLKNINIYFCFITCCYLGRSRKNTKMK